MSVEELSDMKMYQDAEDYTRKLYQEKEDNFEDDVFFFLNTKEMKKHNYEH